MDLQPHLETPAEEWANCLSHGLGAALSLGALVVLVTLAGLGGDPWRIVTVSLYGLALLLMYVASTFFHACSGPTAKRRLRVLDHSAIYTLIAGTYTPFLLVNLRGGWGWSLFGVLWGLAAAGAILKIFFVHRFELLSTAIYLILGWIGVIGFRPVFLSLPTGALAWVIAGGLAYTLGIVFFLWDRLPFNHAIWHLFVLAGSACHFAAILLFVV